MDDKERAKQWQALCEENEQARQRQHKAYAVLIQGMSCVYRGDQSANPPMSAFQEAEAADKAWDDVKRRMREFAKRHA